MTRKKQTKKTNTNKKPQQQNDQRKAATKPKKKKFLHFCHFPLDKAVLYAHLKINPFRIIVQMFNQKLVQITAESRIQLTICKNHTEFIGD